MTMLGSLKALKHFTTSSSVDCDVQPQRKRKKHRKIQKLVKQEYFEYDEMKMEPMEHETGALNSKIMTENGKRVKSELDIDP